MISVCNMESPRTGVKVANQFIIDTGDVRYFQSYDTIIARISVNGIELDEDSYACSRTTIKYRNQFLRRTSKQVEDAIKAGTIKLVSLN